MERRSKRVVKVRINASGKRVAGCVELPGSDQRLSDFLNSDAPCIRLVPNEEASGDPAEGFQVIFKDAITYIEVIDEPKMTESAAIQGSFRSIVAELKEPEAQQIIAEIFVPRERCVLDVLNDPRRFVILRNVHFGNFFERYNFLAVGKKQIILVKV